jgi:hypothetical protein
VCLRMIDLSLRHTLFSNCKFQINIYIINHSWWLIVPKMKYRSSDSNKNSDIYFVVNTAFLESKRRRTDNTTETKRPINTNPIDTQIINCNDKLHDSSKISALFWKQRVQSLNNLEADMKQNFNVYCRM